MANKTGYTRQQIWEKVQKDRAWAERAVVALYERQTTDEQNDQATHHQNRMGFNGFDAEFMSSLAVQINSGRRLSEKQMYHARKALKKYCGQLARIANAALDRK